MPYKACYQIPLYFVFSNSHFDFLAGSSVHNNNEAMLRKLDEWKRIAQIKKVSFITICRIFILREDNEICNYFEKISEKVCIIKIVLGFAKYCNYAI